MLALALFAALQVNPVVVTEPDRHVVEHTSVIDFTTVHVVGEGASPDGAIVYARPKAHRRNLIEMRANFRPELSKSRDDLATAP